jgi:hypothetical protein
MLLICFSPCNEEECTFITFKGLVRDNIKIIELQCRKVNHLRNEAYNFFLHHVMKEKSDGQLHQAH